MELQEVNQMIEKQFPNFQGIISQCEEMKSIFGIVGKVARTNTTVLISGESGTGKELIAKALHTLSGRAGRLVPVNCAAIPEEILESELFGHEKGAFTGAISSKQGRFQLADKGTIFLDEIGEMSAKLQAKLLRVLQDGKIDPVGSTRSVTVDVRVIAATNRNLRDAVKEGRFREDLFYRLQVVPIELPALRERNNDISLLTEYFLKHFSEKFLKEIKISDNALKALNCYNWPGNIRELENLSERLVVLSDSEKIDTKDLPDYIFDNQSLNIKTNIPEEIPDSGFDFNEFISQIEDKIITSALRKTNGNKKAAAELLHLNRTTLVEKIKKKNLVNSIEKENIKNEERPNFGINFENTNVSFSRTLQDV